MEKKGKTFIISGPSGVGKSTVLRTLFEGRDDLYFSVSATTRAPRPTETPDVDYRFIEAETFRQWIGEGEFLEYAEYVGNFYGTPKRYVDEAMEPSWEELERRLKARGTDSPEKIQERLLRAKVELESADSYDYFVINDTVESAVKELRAIMLAEHCRPADRIGMLR